MAIGIDFGTTNTVIATANSTGVDVHTFASRNGPVSNFNSVLFFPEDPEPGTPGVIAGPGALDSYLEHGANGRLLQSLKSFLTSSFESTKIGPRRYTLEELISLILRGLLSEVKRESLSGPVVIGRPVRFVNAKSEEDNLRAEARLRSAVKLAGFSEVTFEYEPVAAAFSYEQRLGSNEVLLVGDFGGGTSDFSLIQVGPAAKAYPPSKRILATSGIGIAGDAFDASIVQNRVTPHFGQGGKYTTLTGQQLEIPLWFYLHVSNWHQLSLLKDPKNLKLLYDMSLLTSGNTRQGLEWLMALIEENLSYYLYQSVAETKAALSGQEKAQLQFNHAPLKIEELVQRKDFEKWIQPSLSEIRKCVQELLTKAGLASSKVDRVFLTGGSAFVPAVRALFAEMFGAQKISGGNEFTSVAQGLALKAAVLQG